LMLLFRQNHQQFQPDKIGITTFVTANANLLDHKESAIVFAAGNAPLLIDWIGLD